MSDNHWGSSCTPRSPEGLENSWRLGAPRKRRRSTLLPQVVMRKSRKLAISLSSDTLLTVIWEDTDIPRCYLWSWGLSLRRMIPRVPNKGGCRCGNNVVWFFFWIDQNQQISSTGIRWHVTGHVIGVHGGAVHAPDKLAIDLEESDTGYNPSWMAAAGILRATGLINRLYP